MAHIRGTFLKLGEKLRTKITCRGCFKIELLLTEARRDLDESRAKILSITSPNYFVILSQNERTFEKRACSIHIL